MSTSKKLLNGLSGSDKALHENYESTHENYDENQPWKLFQSSDFLQYNQYGFIAIHARMKTVIFGDIIWPLMS